MYSYKTHTNSKPESNSSLRPLLHEVAGHNLINTLYVISACCPGKKLIPAGKFGRNNQLETKILI